MTRFTNFAALAAFAASSVTAMPANFARDETSDVPDSLMEWKGDIDDHDAFCTGWDLTSNDGAQEAWKDTHAGWYLDAWVDQHEGTSKNWLRDYEAMFRGDTDVFVMDDCLTIGGNCDYSTLVKNCTASFEHSDLPWEQNAFWIFRAVRNMHDQLTTIYNHFHDATMLQGLKLDNLMDDVHPPKSNTRMWVAEGLVSATGFIGVVPVVGGPVGAFTNLAASLTRMDVLKDPVSPEDYGGDVSEALAVACEDAAEAIKEMLAAATGMAKDDEPYKSLPEYDDTEMKTNIGKFFEHSAWLVESSSDDVQKGLNKITEVIQQRALHEALVADGFGLGSSWGDDESEDDCSGIVGRQYIKWDDLAGCLWLEKDGKIAEARIFDDVLPKYGITNRDWYYRQLMNCEFKKEMEDPDEDNLSRWQKYAQTLEKERDCPFPDMPFKWSG